MLRINVTDCAGKKGFGGDVNVKNIKPITQQGSLTVIIIQIVNFYSETSSLPYRFNIFSSFSHTD